MNRRAFFKTVGIPALALPFVKWLPKPEPGIEIINAPGIYEIPSYMTILVDGKPIATSKPFILESGYPVHWGD